MKNLSALTHMQLIKLFNGDETSAMQTLVSQLPDEQREIIFLRRFADLKFREISKILSINVNTALGRMRYQLLNLCKVIEEKLIAL